MKAAAITPIIRSATGTTLSASPGLPMHHSHVMNNLDPAWPKGRHNGGVWRHCRGA